MLSRVRCLNACYDQLKNSQANSVDCSFFLSLLLPINLNTKFCNVRHYAPYPNDLVLPRLFFLLLFVLYLEPVPNKNTKKIDNFYYVIIN